MILKKSIIEDALMIIDKRIHPLMLKYEKLINKGEYDKAVNTLYDLQKLHDHKDFVVEILIELQNLETEKNTIKEF